MGTRKPHRSKNTHFTRGGNPSRSSVGPVDAMAAAGLRTLYMAEVSGGQKRTVKK